MMTPNLLLLYVEDPIKSAEFYENIFEIKPTALFPTYVSFELENGFNFGLWSKQAKDFVSDGQGHLSEIAFMVSNEGEVHALRDRMGELGVSIEQDLHDAKFGLTFVALDPDHHRIRVCLPDGGK